VGLLAEAALENQQTRQGLAEPLSAVARCLAHPFREITTLSTIVQLTLPNRSAILLNAPPIKPVSCVGM